MMSGIIVGSVSLQDAEALKAKGISSQKYGSSTGVCGVQLCSEIPGGYEAWKQQQSGVTPVVPEYGLEAKNIKKGNDYHVKPVPQMRDGVHDKMCPSCGGHYGMHGMKDSQMKTESNTIQSETDPGLGHEQHQLAVAADLYREGIIDGEPISDAGLTQLFKIFTHPVLGASGAVFGLLAAFASLFPNQRLFLFFIPVPIKAKHFVLGYSAIELYSGVVGREDGVAHFAHVGGALFGYLIIREWRKKHLI